MWALKRQINSLPISSAMKPTVVIAAGRQDARGRARTVGGATLTVLSTNGCEPPTECAADES